MRSYVAINSYFNVYICMRPFADTLDNAGRLGNKLTEPRSPSYDQLQDILETGSYLQRTGTRKAMLSVQEEGAVVGGLELARKTVTAATDEGLVSLRKDQ